MHVALYSYETYLMAQLYFKQTVITSGTERYYISCHWWRHD